MKTYEIIEKIRQNVNEALEEAYQRGKQEGFESNTAYRHGYYDGQKDAYKERKATEQHWGKPTEKTCETCKHNPVIDCGSYPCNECDRWETLSKYEPKKPESTIETILQLIRNDIDAYLVEQGFGSEYRDEIKAFVKTPWEGKEIEATTRHWGRV